jgi:WD40 repeat protein
VNEQGLYSPKSVETHTGYPTKVQLGNKYLVVAVDNGTIELFNSENLQELPPTTTTPAYQRSINSIGLSSNALVSIGDDNGSNGTIKLWEIKENKLSPENFSDSGKTRFTSVDLSKGDREIIAAGNLDGKIQIWELTRDKKDKPLICSRDSHNQKGEIKSVKVFSKDDQTLAISVSKNSKKQILSLWKIQNDTCSFIEEVEEDGNPFESIVFSSDGDLISGGDDKAIRIWDISHFKKSIYEYNEESKLQALEFSSDNSHLASAYSSGKVKLWTVQDDDLKLPLPPCPALDRKISGIGFSQGNKSIIIATDTGNDGVPKRLYELPVSLNSECDKLRKLPNYPENENSIKAIKVSQNAKIIASANADEKIKLWDFNRGTILSTISTDPDLPQSLDISPNHRLLALGSTESKVRLWRIDSTQDKVPELPKLAGHFKGVATISFSPDSETLLSLDGQGTLRLWRISDSKPLAEIQDNQRFLDRIRFNSDKNNPVLAVSIQNRPILWRMELEKLRSQGCDQIRNYLKSNKKDSLCPH